MHQRSKLGQEREVLSHTAQYRMDVNAGQWANATRKDHDESLRTRNTRDAESVIMPLHLDDVRHRLVVEEGNITQVHVDALVNSAQETLTGGGGVDEAIHSVAGPQLRAECESLPFVAPGVRCPMGEARMTRAYNLPHAKHVIHCVGPIGEDAAMLKKVYRAVMQCAHDNKLTSVAFPCISTGYFGFPMLPAARIALGTVAAFLRQHPGTSIARVIFVVFNDVELRIYRALTAKQRKPKMFRPRLGADESPCVLIIDQNPQNNWYAAFRNQKCFNGSGVRVEQTAWQNIVHSRASATNGIVLDLEPTPETPFGTSQSQHRSVSPHLVIVRNFARGAKDEQFLNHLFALQHAGVPCINDIESLLAFYHRANAIHQMHRVEQSIGDPSVFQGE